MNENEIIMNEEVMEQAVEVVTEPSGINFGKIGFGILAAGAVVALGYNIYKVVKAKKAQKILEAGYVGDVECDDFEGEESEE